MQSVNTHWSSDSLRDEKCSFKSWEALGRLTNSPPERKPNFSQCWITRDVKQGIWIPPTQRRAPEHIILLMPAFVQPFMCTRQYEVRAPCYQFVEETKVTESSTFLCLFLFFQFRSSQSVVRYQHARLFDFNLATCSCCSRCNTAHHRCPAWCDLLNPHYLILHAVVLSPPHQS